MSNLSNFLTLSELIALAKNQGVSFGRSDPKVHLAYLAKLGLIPPALKRKSNGKLEGHYPLFVLDNLTDIEKMKNDGLTYAQIKAHRGGSNMTTPNLTPSPYPILMLVLGLILGFLLAQVNRPVSSAINLSTLPVQFQKGTIDNGTSSLYLISIPNNQGNLNKVGTIDIK